MSTAEKRHYTPEEYLEFERASPFKHQYYKGEIFAMTGASFVHNQIVSNLLRSLGNKLEKRPCQALPSDLRVKVDPTGLYTYPDVIVVCSEPEFEDNVLDTLLNPKVIVEVLSTTTEAYDRGRKFAQYRLIESLEQYVLVSQEEYLVEVFTKQVDGQWTLSDARGLEASIELSAIGCVLALSEVYQRVELSDSKETLPHD